MSYNKTDDGGKMLITLLKMFWGQLVKMTPQ